MRNVTNLIRLADHLAKTRGPFDMQLWEICVCGHALKLLAGQWASSYRNADDVITSGAALLNIPRAQAVELFNAAGRDDITAAQASRVVRHLAESGKVDWARAKYSPALLDA